MYRAFVRAGLQGPIRRRRRSASTTWASATLPGGADPRRGVSTEVPRLQREPIGCSLEELLRGRSDDALALAYCAGYSLRELAAVLGVHYSTVSRRLKREEQALGLT